MLTNAPSTLRKLRFSIPGEQAVAWGRARLRVTWDGRQAPSIDAPLALFFGAGTLYNRADGKSYSGTVTVKSKSALDLSGCVAAVFCKTTTFTRVK